MSGRLIEALAALPHDTEYVLPWRSDEQARGRIRKLCFEAGVPYLGIHSFRHSAGVRVIKTGGTLQDAARHLGHSSIETAALYTHWADDSLKKRVADW